MSTSIQRKRGLQLLVIFFAFGCQFIGLVVAYVLLRSEWFYEALGRLSHSSVGPNARLALSFAIGLGIQAGLSTIAYLLWPRRRNPA